MDAWPDQAGRTGRDRLTGLAGVERFGRPYTLLADGTTLTIRSAACEDHEPVRRLLGDDAPCAQSW